MNWFYAEGNQQRGPVSDEQLQELLRLGTLSPATMVWREGMANWQPYSSLQKGNAPPQALPANATGAICVECGRSFPSDEIVRIHNAWVCAACKPLFLQRIIEGAPPPSAGVWRSGKVLVAAKESAFPDRCVKCNAPVNGWRLKRNLYYYPPYVILLILLSLLIGLIVAMIVRKNARVEIGLCELHRSKRVRNMLIGALMTIGGFVLMIMGLGLQKGIVGLIGFAALVCGLVFLAKAAPISVKRIDARFVWIKGVCRPYLDMLPEWKEGD